MRLIWICRKKRESERERMCIAKTRGTRPTRVRTHVRTRIRICAICVYIYIYIYIYIQYIYIARSSSFGKFSETFGMTSEARMKNTDFSIARILSNDCSPKTRADDEGRRSVERDERKPRVCFFPIQEASEEQASRREGETPEREERADRVVPDETIPDAMPIVDVTQIRRADLTWLQYTRYRPPKLPRRSYVERRIKRRTDDRPRIPFSSSQLQVLEDRYRKSAYLSRNDVVEMSAMLRLPQSKIKIWFQNRRARQRRESLNSTIVAR